MAEAAVGFVVDKLIELLTKETSLLSAIHKEVEEIKSELEDILNFLRDADSKAEAEANNYISHGVKNWVEELRELTFEITDVIDEYTHFIVAQQGPHRHKSIIFLRKIACFILQLKPRHDIASKIKDLKNKVQVINKKGTTYGFSTTQQGSTLISAQTSTWYDPWKDSLFLKETELVGIESVKEELIGVLEGESSERRVIAVVGMGGLGKTTLVYQVYNHVKRYVDCHAWIDVSQRYDKVELLRNLMKKLFQGKEPSILDEIDGLDETAIATKIRDHLGGKRYVVVFDDVWNRNFWSDVEQVLPDDSKKSGIFITTRDIGVVKLCGSMPSCVHIHQLQHLPEEKAWELFCSKAFHSEPERKCATYLNDLSREIVRKCGGLPLAIVVIAGLLSAKNKNIDEWRKLCTSLSSELESNVNLTSIDKILSLSYSDLPYYLKSCFLYFGIFPEQFSIRTKILIQQWIAEGLVNPTADKTSEVVAEEYLAELLNRSLVQVSKVDVTGKVRILRIHDLLRVIIIKKMKDLSFCQVLSGNDSSSTRVTRRLSLSNGSSGVINWTSPDFSHVQSIFVFDKDEMLNNIASTMATNFKLLKVLNFEDTPSLDHLPEDIGRLFHLRYLSLRGTKVKLLPKSIGKLENLETLDLKRTEVYELPVEINRLRKLRCLVAYLVVNDREFYLRRGVKTGEGIGNLTELQKLFHVEANVDGVNFFEELSKLTNLRRLGLGQLRSKDGKALCECIQKMNHLESLDICSTTEDETIDLESMSSPPQSLQRVYLVGRLNKLPKWIPELQALVRVRFFWSMLEDDPLKALQNLPNLLELGFYRNGYYGEKMHFEKGAFPKLKVLVLRNLSRLNSLVIEEGALSSLENLEIGPCPQLKGSHSGFQHLRSLKRISFYEFSKKFLMSNSQIIQTLPHVHAWLHHTIAGKLLRIQLERVRGILYFVQDDHQVNWESSDIGEILSKPQFSDVMGGVSTVPPPEYDNSTRTKEILSRSYTDLPYYLKPCLLYFGLFPEDYCIRSTRLIRQWIAEGFIKTVQGKTLEVVAEEYLAELLKSSLVQVSHVDFNGKARSFRIHNILHDIILRRKSDLSFCQVWSGKDSNFTREARWVSLANGSHEVIKRSSQQSFHVRSILIFDKEEIPYEIVSTIAAKFQLLKVLDLEDAPCVEYLPKDIGRLFHLRYLSLRGTKVKLLPKSIGKLENLETLDLKRTEVYELPVEINRLRKLRCLVAYLVVNDREFYNRRGVKTGEGIGNLTELQKLFHVEANDDGVNFFEELSKLTNLRRLGLGQLRSKDGKALCECIQKMNHLESLDICSTTEDETIDLESMSSPPQSLQRVYLVGRLNKLPKWIPELQALVRVRFFWSMLEDDPLKALQNLPNLLELGFYRNGYYGEKMHFDIGAFPKLKVLVLRNLSRLNSLVIEEGALSSLENLEIGPCPQLKGSHSGFQHLRSLKHISFYKTIPTKVLMYYFQSTQTVLNIWLHREIEGKLVCFPLEEFKDILHYMQEHDYVDWGSLDFEEILSYWNEPERSASGSSSPEN